MKKFAYSLLLLVCLLMIVNPVQAQDSKVVLLIMDRVSITELQETATPYLDQIIAQGAVGLMNAETAGSLEPKDTYLTIGAGDRARAGRAGYLNFNATAKYQGVTAESLYQRRVAQADKGEIVNLQLAQLKKSNQTTTYQARVGHLADLLQRKNLQVTVLGNADTKNQPRRHVALLGLNKYGVVNQGDVGQQMVQQVDQYPSSYITNQSYLVSQFKNYWDQSDLLVVEAGNTSRIAAIKSLLTEQRFKEAKRKAIQRSDRLLGKLLEIVDLQRDYLLVVTPTPAKEAIEQGNKLTLTSIVGPQVKDGLLKSATTRRQGLITNLDLAPTIYHYLTSEQADFTGRSIFSQATNKSVDYLLTLQNKIRRTFAWRPIVVKGFILLQILTLGLVGVVWIYKRNNNLLRKISLYLLISLLWIPSLFLLSRFFIIGNLTLVIGFWLMVSLGLAYYTLQLVDNNLVPVILPALVTTGLLVFDLWQGGEWIKLSVLGYSPVIGARFYGVGNEFMGVIIGAGIMALTGLQELTSKLSDRLLLIGFGLLVLTVGYPRLGANFGGLITAIIACSITYLNLRGYKFKLSTLLKLSFILISSLLFIITVDFYIGNETHLAHTLSRIQKEGINQLFLIIYRKLQMNLKLLRWTIWSRVLLSFVVILFILFKWPAGKIKDLIISYPSLAAGFRGVVGGSVVTMLVNDSGVVAAATLLLFPVFTLLYLLLNCKLNS
ncbi:hypothetical protein [Halanaerobaculum tunisiense]